MSLIGLTETADIYTSTEASDGYGGVKKTNVLLINDWKCRVKQDFSAWARTKMAESGRLTYIFSGEASDLNISRGNLIVWNSQNFEIVQVEKRTDPYGTTHHVYIRAESKT